MMMDRMNSTLIERILLLLALRPSSRSGIELVADPAEESTATAAALLLGRGGMLFLVGTSSATTEG